MEPSRDYTIYKEYPLNGRVKLAYNWIPDMAEVLLDGGCSWGYGTRFFRQKCEHTYGIDTNEDFIKVAALRYPQIQFQMSGLEKMPFQDDYFDVVVLNDVIEHVADEKESLEEVCRVLKEGGSLILTTPHKGLFGFLDPGNYGILLRNHLPWLFKIINRAVRGGKTSSDSRKPPDLHRHYVLEELRNILDSTSFKDNYEITEVFRSGLFLGLLAANLHFIFCKIFGGKFTDLLLTLLSYPAQLDYWIPYGRCSSDIALKIIKKGKN